MSHAIVQAMPTSAASCVEKPMRNATATRQSIAPKTFMSVSGLFMRVQAL